MTDFVRKKRAIHPSGKIVAACTRDGRSVARREESP
jgi:hypothetical protein